MDNLPNKQSKLKNKINTQKQFREKLVEEVVQPLLDLYSSPTCPDYIETKGKKPDTSTCTRLTGKHFAYKNTARQCCIVCSKKPSPTTGKRKEYAISMFDIPAK